MNKIYRRLWSTARQCWVVASELSAARGKSSQLVGAGVLALALTLSSSGAWAAEEVPVDEPEDVPVLDAWALQAAFGSRAAISGAGAAPFAGVLAEPVIRQNAFTTDHYYRDSTVDGDLLTVLGSRSTLSGSRSVAYGSVITSRGTNNTAIGYNVQITNGGYATAVGAESVASGVGTTVLGNNAKAYSENSIAVGSGANTVNSSAGVSRIAIGGNAYAGTAGWSGAVALGGNSRAEYDAVAVGHEARSTAEGALAMGRGAQATAANALAMGKGAKAQTASSLAVGRDAQTAATGSIAIGQGARITDAFAQDSIAIGRGANTQHLSSIALGSGSVTTGNWQVAVGSSSRKRRIVGVEDAYLARSSDHAVTGGQLYVTNENVTRAQRTADEAAAGARLVTQSSPSSAIRMGAENTGTVIDVANAGGTKRRIQNIANGVLSAGSTDAVTGQQLNATNVEVASVRTTATSAQTTAGAAKTAADNALAKANALGGLVSQTSATSNVRVGGENTGTMVDVRNKSNANRKVTGVAEATLSASSTEAVSGKQLNATNVEVASVRTTATSAQTMAGAAKTAADNALAKANALGGLVSQTSATSNVRLGGENTGTMVDVRNKSNANRKLTGVAEATLSASSTEAVSGKQLNATNVEVASVRTTATSAQTTANTAKTTADNALAKADVLGGLVGQVSATGNVRLGGENTGTVLDVRNKSNANRKLMGVADATLSTSSTEAVTGRQLFGVDQKVTANQSLLASHATELAGHEARIAGNRRDLDDLRNEFDNFDPDLEGVVRYAADGSIDMDGGKVRGVAAGDISSAGSTDAVNGGQLFATNYRLSAIESAGDYVKVSTDEYSESAEAGRFGVAIGDGARASLGKEGGTAIGSFTSADARDSVALGRGANVGPSGDQGFAMGVGTNVYATDGVALGAYARVEAGAVGSVALGAGSIADVPGTVSMGHGSLQRRLVNVGRGTADTDATTAAQLDESLASLGGGAGIDVNGIVIAPTYRMQGATQRNVEDALNILDGAVITAGSRVDQVENQLRSVFQSSPSVHADGINHVVLAGAGGAILTNLADGRVQHGSRDAVTGSQLFEAKREIARNRSELNELQRDRSDLKSTDMAVAMAAAADVDFGGNRLTGISNGRISDGSSDAMTGAQLFQTNERVSDLELTNKVIAISSKNHSDSLAKAGDRSVAIGEYASASVDSEGGTAVGNYAQARAKNSVAIGQSSSVSDYNEGGLAIGSSARASGRGSMAIGERAWVFGAAENSVAIGAGSEAMRSNEVSIGTYSNRRRLTSVANGIASYDAATAGQLRDALSSLGGGATLDRQGNLVSPSYKIQGGQQNTVNDALTALDTALITSSTRVDRVENQLRAVFQESPATRSDGLGQLNLAGANGMVLGNVANGLIAPGSRDAVNGGQLHAMEQRLDGRIDGLEQRVDATPEGRALASASAPTAPVAPEAEGPAGASGEPAAASAGRAGGGIASADGGGSPAPADAPAPTPQVNTADLEKMLARANEYTDGAISNFERRLDKMDKRFNRMAAMSSAQSAMAMNTAGLATYNRLGAGVGYSDGESALAVGYQRVLNERGSATFSLNGAFTNSGEQSVGLGVGIGW